MKYSDLIQRHHGGRLETQLSPHSPPEGLYASLPSRSFSPLIPLTSPTSLNSHLLREYLSFLAFTIFTKYIYLQGYFISLLSYPLECKLHTVRGLLLSK